MVLGSLTAMGAGAVMPFFSFLFGDVTLIYLDPDPIKKALEIAIKFWLLGVAAWVLSNCFVELRLLISVLLGDVRGTPIPSLP